MYILLLLLLFFLFVDHDSPPCCQSLASPPPRFRNQNWLYVGRCKGPECTWVAQRRLLFAAGSFFLRGSHGKKQGDFGIFTSCIAKNSSLRLECYYAACPQSPPFSCTFMANGVVLYTATNDMCKMFFPDQSVLSANGTTSYNCTLTRKKRTEEKQLTIDPRKRTGKKRIRPCPDTTGLHLHQAPPSLWPVVTLSLWRVLVTDSQAT